jgi:hypothetical protein
VGILLAFAIAGAPAGAPRAAVDLASLLDEMIDRDAQARVPAPSFTCRQSSSYDRDTVAPDKDGWFANWDRSQFMRVEEREGRKEYFMHEADGPGAIVRIWATWHGPGGGPFSNGTLRVYIDNASAPAIEGPVADVISGGAIGNLGWSCSRQLRWIDGVPGDKLAFTFPVAQAGRYRIEAELTKAVDYGIVQVLVNGAKVGPPIDFFAEKVTHVRADLGEFDLPAGANRLEIVITGANPRAIKRHMFGLDYLLLTKQ